MRLRNTLRRMTWWGYVQQVTGSAPQIEIAKKTGINSSTISRWQGGEPKPVNVVTFAKAYDRPVLEAFVGAGFLTVEDADAEVVITQQHEPTDDQLIDLLRKRLARAKEREGHDRPAPNTAARDRTGPPQDELSKWDDSAARLRAAGFTERAVVDTLGPRPLTSDPGHGASHGGAGQNDEPGEGRRRA